MAKKGISQTDLEQGVVGSAAAAGRIIDVMRFFPQVLLREDPRVQAAYRSWLERMPDEAPTLQEDKWRILGEDATQLFALLRDLGLEQYRWLPRMLRFEFDRATHELVYSSPTTIDMTPQRRALVHGWQSAKQKAGAYGGFRLEDIERNLLWFRAWQIDRAVDSEPL
jgi:hypothetical protein